MKIGLYSVTYRGVWYRGEAVDVFDLVRLAKQQGWEGLELDAERPHASPMDLSADNRKRLRDLAGELGLELCAVSPNCDLSSPVPIQREAMIAYVRESIKLAHDLGSPRCARSSRLGAASLFMTAWPPTTKRMPTTSTAFGRVTVAASSSNRCANSVRWRRITASPSPCRIMAPTS